MPGWVSPWELLILLAFVLLLFGPKRLPEMGRSLGKGMREFKDSISGKDDEDDKDEPAELPPAGGDPRRGRAGLRLVQVRNLEPPS